MGTGPGFKDHFSDLAHGYQRFRPRYPHALFAVLAGLAPACDLAWDVGCGSGQASHGLVDFFARVVATDASADQIAKATPHDRIEFRVAHAEASGLETRCADLVLVAQALHWFDLEAFYAEVRRVARPGALIAAVAYQLFAIDDAIDGAVHRFYRDVLGPYWPPERKMIDDAYAAIAFPFAPVAAPQVMMTAQWALDDVLGYLGTWSAVARYRKATGNDPLPVLAGELASLWGDGAAARLVSWPLRLRLGRFA